MFTNVILTVPSRKSEQTICVSTEAGFYFILNQKKWASVVKRLAHLDSFEIFRPYYDSPRVTISGAEFAEMVGEHRIGSARKRQHSDKVKSSAWQTLWDRLEGWLDEKNESDQFALSLIEQTYKGKKLESALGAYEEFRKEGWGSHESIVKMIRDFKKLFDRLPESFDWKPEGILQ